MVNWERKYFYTKVLDYTGQETLILKSHFFVLHHLHVNSIDSLEDGISILYMIIT